VRLRKPKAAAIADGSPAGFARQEFAPGSGE